MLQSNWIRKACIFVEPMPIKAQPARVVRQYELPGGNLKALVYRPVNNGDVFHTLGLRIGGWDLATEESTLDAWVSFDAGAHLDWVSVGVPMNFMGAEFYPPPTVIPVLVTAAPSFELFASVLDDSEEISGTGLVEAWYQPDTTDDDSHLSPLGNLNRGGVLRKGGVV